MYEQNDARDYLMHYGVPGMKWGHRKALPTSSTYNRMANAKQAKKQAYKQYNKDFNKAYGYSYRHSIGQLVSKSKKAESNSRWNTAQKSAEAYNKANADYKKAKADRKAKIKDQTKKLNDKASLGQKLVYNNATRKKAAKYMVDNNMSMADATKRAQGDAWKNTAALIAAYGAVTAASLYKMNH